MTTDTEALNYDHIVALALEHGFKFKSQVDGRMALNDYVIDFARAVYDIGHAAAKAETAAAVAAERERAAMICERIADDYNRREGLKYPELKTDAETGAYECADAIRAGAKEPSDA